LCTCVTIFSELRFDLIVVQGIFIRIIGNFSLFFAMGFSGLILSDKIGFTGLLINTEIAYRAKIKRMTIYGGVVGVLMGALNTLGLTHGLYTIYDSILKMIERRTLFKPQNTQRDKFHLYIQYNFYLLAQAIANPHRCSIFCQRCTLLFHPDILLVYIRRLSHDSV